MRPTFLSGARLASELLFPTAIPIALDPAVYRGADVLGDDGLKYYSDGEMWRTGKSFIGLVNISVTVGAGGDYPSINAALEYVLQFTPKNGGSLASATITILAGHTVAEQVFITGIDASWIQLESQDAWVPVDAAAMLNPVLFDTADLQRPLFGVYSATSMRIACKFVLTGTRPTGSQVYGIDARGGLFINSPDPVGNRTIGFDGFDVGVRAGAQSRARLNTVDVQNYTVAALLATGGGEISVVVGNTSVFRSATVGASVLYATGLGRIYSQIDDCRRVVGVDNSTDIRVEQGAIIALTSISFGGQNQQSNVPTNKGIIFRTATGPALWAGIFDPASYTVATVPSASANNGNVIHVSNGDTGAPCLAVSNGTNWLRIALGAAVST